MAHGIKRRTPQEVLESYEPDLPAKGAAWLTRIIMKLMLIRRPATHYYAFDKREMKGRPVLILAQHVSRDDPYVKSED